MHTHPVPAGLLGSIPAATHTQLTLAAGWRGARGRAAPPALPCTRRRAIAVGWHGGLAPSPLPEPGSVRFGGQSVGLAVYAFVCLCGMRGHSGRTGGRRTEEGVEQVDEPLRVAPGARTVVKVAVVDHHIRRDCSRCSEDLQRAAEAGPVRVESRWC